ncbi:hypothetical protein BROOK1789B_1643 [Bathymodiolus brooksi thiotrophic gill symbiont]|nr:hypothetical protein BROOK1789B_1643 [Bathymodiolus brooksi thiotrophic gill symbiont]
MVKLFKIVWFGKLQKKHLSLSVFILEGWSPHVANKFGLQVWGI